MTISNTQTVWNRKVNVGTYVTPETIHEEVEDDDINIVGFLQKVYQLMEEALQSNETIDIFQDDFNVLPDEEVSSEITELSNTIKEIKSFTYLKCKGKVSCVQFQPPSNYVKYLLNKRYTKKKKNNYSFFFNSVFFLF